MWFTFLVTMNQITEHISVLEYVCNIVVILICILSVCCTVIVTLSDLVTNSWYYQGIFICSVGNFICIFQLSRDLSSHVQCKTQLVYFIKYLFNTQLSGTNEVIRFCFNHKAKQITFSLSQLNKQLFLSQSQLNKQLFLSLSQLNK